MADKQLNNGFLLNKVSDGDIYDNGISTTNMTSDEIENDIKLKRKKNRDAIKSIISNKSDDINKLLWANCIGDTYTPGLFNFSRFGNIDPFNRFKSTKEYIFFTKPDLHIFKDGDITKLNDELVKYPFFERMKQTDSSILQLLQRSAQLGKKFSGGGYFIPLLTNRVSGSLDLPDIDGTSLDTNSNVFGDTITYRWTSAESDHDISFNLEFQEDQYLSIYKFFKTYDEYNRLKSLGMVSPPNRDYIIKKILHDQFSVFKIIVEEDGESIIYFAKLWGVYPTGVPRSMFSNLDGSELKVPITFKAAFVEDFNPLIIKDFNYAAGFYKITGEKSDNASYYENNILPVYDTKNQSINGDWAGVPFIINSATLGGSQSYGDEKLQTYWKLKWAKRAASNMNMSI